MSAIIQFFNLTHIHQNKVVIDDVTFSVEDGDIFGFVGANGAGKTTVIRIMSTLLVPTRGDVLIDGNSVIKSPELVRKLIGYVPDQFGFYSELTTWEYLDFFGACYKIHYRERINLISTLLELVDLNEQKDVWVKELSLGMKQRLMLACALLNDPKVLILDNPLSNMDFFVREEFLGLLSELGQLGKTIFLSSPILSDITTTCNRIGILRAGRLIGHGSVQELEKMEEFFSKTTKDIVS